MHDRRESGTYVEITSRELYTDFSSKILDRQPSEWRELYPDVNSCRETWETYVDITSQDLYPNVDFRGVTWESGNYLHTISWDFYEDLGGTGLDWRSINWIFSEFDARQATVHDPFLS
jgi:hypothetical protein